MQAKLQSALACRLSRLKLSLSMLVNALADAKWLRLLLPEPLDVAAAMLAAPALLVLAPEPQEQLVAPDSMPLPFVYSAPAPPVLPLRLTALPLCWLPPPRRPRRLDMRELNSSACIRSSLMMLAGSAATSSGNMK